MEKGEIVRVGFVIDREDGTIVVTGWEMNSLDGSSIDHVARTFCHWKIDELRAISANEHRRN